MAEKKQSAKGAKRSGPGFSDEERAAMREAVRERSRPHPGKADGEREVLDKIAGMDPPDRVMAERLHAIMKTHAPDLTPRTWYGMPAYSKGDDVVCFFQDTRKFKARYATLGFSDSATLDDGRMWPIAYALKELSPAEEAKIVALVKRAIG